MSAEEFHDVVKKRERKKQMDFTIVY